MYELIASSKSRRSLLEDRGSRIEVDGQKVRSVEIGIFENYGGADNEIRILIPIGSHRKMRSAW
jgi:hypothetical protein